MNNEFNLFGDAERLLAALSSFCDPNSSQISLIVSRSGDCGEQIITPSFSWTDHAASNNPYISWRCVQCRKEPLTGTVFVCVYICELYGYANMCVYVCFCVHVCTSAVGKRGTANRSKS